jgi:galactose mutarotase-like enzyme
MTAITISSGALSAAIAPLGAELQSIRDAAGREYLHGGSSFWTGRAPLLFPIVGALKDDRHTLDGKVHPMPKHGFARHSLFQVADASPDRALFRLKDSEETRAAYPYKFQLDALYSLAGATLTCAVTVTNADARPLPVAFGFHPAFRWPLPGAGDRSGYEIEFAQDEPGPVSRIDKAGLIAREEPSPVDGRRLAVADGLFEDDALIFLDPRSRSLRFGPAGGGSPALQIEYQGLPQLGIWTKPGAPYLCIEPWAGYASPADYSGPLTAKPGSVNLAPGGAKTFSMSVTLVVQI